MSKRDPENPVDLSPSGARDYAQRIAAAKQSTPVGHTEMPSIPRLDQPPPGAPRDRAMGVQQSQGQQAAAQGMTRAMTPQQYEQAVQGGQAMAGVGGAYVANQPPGAQQLPPEEPPALEMERTGQNGQMANPVRPEGGLSPQTLEQLNAVAEANKESPEEDKEEDKDDDFDDFDFEEFGRASKDILYNKARREAIEAKITDEMDFEGLIINQELRQSVPIRKGFTPTYRTPGGHEDLFVKRLIGKVEGSERYILDHFAIMGLVCGLYALNGRPLPSHLDSNGNPDEKLFDAKMKLILRYPLVIVTDLSANFTWFSTRVQKLLALDKVKDF